MGYGGSREDAGRSVGRSGDGGIDGIINEDRLGLDIVYIQAKQWKENVSRPEIQKFAGALQGQRARKGVFITTSSFTKGAEEYVKTIDSKIILIDGNQLAQYMIDHNVGVSVEKTYQIKRVDSDYFIDPAKQPTPDSYREPEHKPPQITPAKTPSSETHQRQMRYWTGLRDYIVEKGSFVSFPSPRPLRYLDLSIGRTNFWLMIWQTPTRSEIGIWLNIGGENREAFFHLLQEEQDDIHTEMGEELEWIELLGKQRNRICLHKEDTDPQDESDWPQQFEWFTTKLERFNQVFRERIRGLDAADWIPEDDAP